MIDLYEVGGGDVDGFSVAVLNLRLVDFEFGGVAAKLLTLLQRRDASERHSLFLFSSKRLRNRRLRLYNS